MEDKCFYQNAQSATVKNQGLSKNNNLVNYKNIEI